MTYFPIMFSTSPWCSVKLFCTFYIPLNLTFREFGVLTPFVGLRVDRQARRVQRPDQAKTLRNKQFLDCVNGVVVLSGHGTFPMLSENVTAKSPYRLFLMEFDPLLRNTYSPG